MRPASLRYAGVLTLVALVAACDEAVFVPGELAARKRYETVAVGTREPDLRAELGAPECVVVRSGDPAGAIEVRCPEDGPARVGDEATVRSGSPTWVAVMPLPASGQRLLIDVDGTVYGYYTLDANGVVTRVKAVIS